MTPLSGTIAAMLSVGRIVTVTVIGVLVYTAFWAVPPGERADGLYDVEKVAASELAVWRAAQAQEEFGAFLNLVAMLREEHRYSWFRAAQASFHLARATTTFVGLRSRYERVLPDLEDAAAVHKAWTDAPFDPAAVARAQLTWWVTRRLPNLNSVDQLTPLILEEYALRYRVTSGAAVEAAQWRAQAVLLFDATGTDPNVAELTKLLVESHRSLARALAERRPVR